MKKLLLMFLLLVPIVSMYADDDAESIVSSLQKKYDNVKDISISFVQNVQFAVTQNTQTFSGTLVMKKGNKYRIEMEQQTIVTDGTTVWTFNKANNQVFIDKYKNDSQSFSPDKILTNLPDNYTAEILGKEKHGDHDLTILKLLPKKTRMNIKWMKVWVDTDSWTMKKIQVFDASENLWTYDVNDVRMDTGVADTQFHFDAPAGVDVIDLR